MEAVNAFVLAGGRSSRMGVDKAQLTFRDQTLLVRAVQVAAAVASRVFIVGSRQRYATFGDVVEDVYADCGPLGGIHAALSATETDVNLILSVDIPLMTADFLRWLVKRASGVCQWMVVPHALGGQQPLCAVYRRPVRVLAEQSLNAGDYKVGHLYARTPTLHLLEAEIREAGFSPEIFRNVNTFEEYEALVRDGDAPLAKGRCVKR